MKIVFAVTIYNIELKFLGHPFKQKIKLFKKVTTSLNEKSVIKLSVLASDRSAKELTVRFINTTGPETEWTS